MSGFTGTRMSNIVCGYSPMFDIVCGYSPMFDKLCGYSPGTYMSPYLCKI